MKGITLDDEFTQVEAQHSQDFFDEGLTQLDLIELKNKRVYELKKD